MPFPTQLGQHLAAGARGFWVHTYEEPRVIKELQEYCEQHRMFGTQWSLVRGLSLLGHPEADTLCPADSNNPLGTAIKWLTTALPLTGHDGLWMLVLTDAHVYLKDGGTRLVKDLVLHTHGLKGSVVCLSPKKDIPIELERIFTQLPLSLPDADELAASGIPFSGSVEDRRHLADAAVGLSIHEAQIATRVATQQYGKAVPKVYQSIWDTKAKYLETKGLVKVVIPKQKWADVGGMYHFKRHIESMAPLLLESNTKVPPPDGFLLVGFMGCIHGDTLIEDALDGSMVTVRDRFIAGKSFHVWSRVPDGSVVRAIAMPPIKYLPAKMIRFTFDNGQTLAVTERHRFFQNGRWVYASEVYEQLHEGGDVLLDSSSESDRQVRMLDALSSRETVLDSLNGYRRDLRSYDGQLLQEGDIDPTLLLQQLGVREYILPLWHKDDLVRGQGYIHPAVLESIVASGSSPSKRSFIKVLRGERIGKVEYYDFHVPVYENYLAAGVWNHNTGKSLISRAVASYLSELSGRQWKYLEWNTSNIYRPYVGETEAATREILQLTELHAPCVVRIDEIAHQLSGHGAGGRSDAGVTDRLIGSIMTWLEERKPGCLVMASTNEPDKLPAHVSRAGRLSSVWGVSLPGEDAALEILRIHLNRFAPNLMEEQLEPVVEKMVRRKFSGAEIQEAVLESAQLMYPKEPSMERLMSTVDAVIPAVITKSEEYERITTWIKQKAREA